MESSGLVWSCSYDSEIYENPRNFNPSRWNVSTISSFFFRYIFSFYLISLSLKKRSRYDNQDMVKLDLGPLICLNSQEKKHMDNRNNTPFQTCPWSGQTQTWSLCQASIIKFKFKLHFLLTNFQCIFVY